MCEWGKGRESMGFSERPLSHSKIRAGEDLRGLEQRSMIGGGVCLCLCERRGKAVRGSLI